MDRPELSLVVPAYNEAACIPATVCGLVEAFARAAVRLELVVVDNGSRDESPALIEQLAVQYPEVVACRVDVNRGKGHGVRIGLSRCRGTFAGWVDADGQIDADDVVQVFLLCRDAQSAALAKVRRDRRAGGWRRQLISKAFNALTQRLFPAIEAHDLNATPKIFPQALIERLDLRSDNWWIDFEVMYRAARLGLPIVEHPADERPRGGGRSHIRLSTAVMFLGKLLAFRLQTLAMRRRDERPDEA